MSRCQECGAEFDEGEVCPECGAEQTDSAEGRNERVVVGLLALFLGAFGAHKFYQGATKLGVMYLAIFWTAIPLMMGVVEGVVILTTTDEIYERKYADGSILGR